MIEPVHKDLIVNASIDPRRFVIHRIIDGLLPGDHVFLFGRVVMPLHSADDMEAEIGRHLEMIPVKPFLLGDRDCPVSSVFMDRSFILHRFHQVPYGMQITVVTYNQLRLQYFYRTRNQECKRDLASTPDCSRRTSESVVSGIKNCVYAVHGFPKC